MLVNPSLPSSYQNCLEQLKKISTLANGHTLCVYKPTKELDVSYGNHHAYLGAYVNSAAGYLNGFGLSSYSHDYQEVSYAIQKLVEETATLVAQESTNRTELHDAIYSAQRRIKVLGKFYANNEQAKQKFEALSAELLALYNPEIFEIIESEELLINPKDLTNEALNAEESFAMLSSLQEDWQQDFAAQKVETLQDTLFAPLGRMLQTGKCWFSCREKLPVSHYHLPGYWQQLNNVILFKYLEQMKEELTAQEKPFTTVSSFYAMKTTATCTLDEMKAAIEEHIAEHTLKKPIFIPIVQQGHESYGRNHIVAILIKDGAIEYFDSKAVPSDHITLKSESGNLNNLLHYCSETYGLKIFENTIPIQHDMHSCGDFISLFMESRLVEEAPVGAMRTHVSQDELFQMRKKIYEKALVKLEEESSYDQAPSSCASTEVTTNWEDFEFSL